MKTADNTKKRKLTVKQQKFAAKVAGGSSKVDAYREVYNTNTTNKQTLYREAHETARKPQVQEAIDNALIKLHATPEYAVSKIKSVSDMELNDRSASSVLKASNTILELHGWRKDERPTTTLNIKNAFFKPRDRQQ